MFVLSDQYTHTHTHTRTFRDNLTHVDGEVTGWILKDCFLSSSCLYVFLWRACRALAFLMAPFTRTHTVGILGANWEGWDKTDYACARLIPLQHPSNHLQVQWSKTHRACVRGSPEGR